MKHLKISFRQVTDFIAGDIQYNRGEIIIGSDGIYQFRLSARADANLMMRNGKPLYLLIVQNGVDKLRCTAAQSTGEVNGAYLRCG